MQAIFGAGIMWGTPLTDNTGAPISNPTPRMIGTIQEASVDISFDSKMLHGSDSQFPKYVAQGKGSINGKVKMGTIKGAVFADLFFGQALNNGLQSVKYDTVGSAVATTVTPVVPSSGTFLNNLGVVFRATGMPLKRVASAPVAGEYSVDIATGVYTFATADAGLIVFINFSYTATVANAVKQTVQAVPMGYTPTFRMDLYLPYDGKSLIMTLPKCMSNKLSFGTKLDDFTLPDLEFIAYANEAGEVITWSTSE